jgi:hypothetical protein
MEAEPSALYLISNSLTNPNNTAGNFSVLYNTPLNLTGKKIALANATFTKGQSNVLEEAITVAFKQPAVQIEKGPATTINLANDVVARGPRNWANFFDWLNRDFLNSISVRTEFSTTTKKATTVVKNLSDFECEVSVHTDVPHGWVVTCSAPPALVTNITIPDRSLAGSLVMLKIPVGDTRAVTMDVSDATMFNFLQTEEEFQAIHRKLFQFKLTYFPSKHIPPVKDVVVQPGPGHFASIQALLSKINKDVKFAKIGTFHYVTGKVKLVLKREAVKKVLRIDFGGLQHHFGFDSASVKFTTPKSSLIAERAPDMTRGTHNFFIYSSLVKRVLVNEQKVPLVAVLDATAGEYGQQIQHHVRSPIFLDCVDGPQQKVEVSIADDSGSVSGLLQGITMLTFSIKPASS